jgi:predicted pyridoxine 5'-phosphate oxidase superfamily flavin-nucleotide-binding protein
MIDVISCRAIRGQRQHTVLAMGLAIATSWHLPAQAGELRAGAARVSITPPATEFPFVSGNEKPFVGIHDDVYARVIVLDDGQRRAALVMLEVTKVPTPDAISKSIAREIGARESDVMVAATHTHNVLSTSYHGGEPGPVHARDIERVQQGALAAARQATASLQAARIGFGRGEAWVNINNGEQAGSKKWFDPKGPSDKSLDVLRIETRDGKPIALLVNYATHAEVMFRSVTRDGGYEISGDLPGAVSRLLEAQSAGAAVVLFSSGAEGDQLSLFKSLQPAGQLPAADEGAAGWALLNVQSRRLAGSVVDVIAAMKPATTTAQIDTAVASVTCPGQQLRIDSKTGQINVQSKPAVTIPLSVIRINDIVLAGVGGDVGTDIGRAFKAQSPYPQSTMITMVGDAIGYILTDGSYSTPGHGVAGSPLKSGCAERAVVNGLVQLLKPHR